MAVKVASGCTHCSQNPIINGSASSSRTLNLAIPCSSTKLGFLRGESLGFSLACHSAPRNLSKTAYPVTKPRRFEFCELCKHSPARSNTEISKLKRRSCSASLLSFSGEKYVKGNQELSSRSQNKESRNWKANVSKGLHQEIIHDLVYAGTQNHDRNIHIPEPRIALDPVDSPWDESECDAHIERKASRVDLPHSLRLIKKKMQLEGGFWNGRESASSSVKRAFSSLVLMIEELHSFTLRIRELLLYEDVRGILSGVQTEMHASFVWLFQRVLYQTPGLMVYVMILLANFTVHKMGNKTAAAAVLPSAVSGITCVSKNLGHKTRKSTSATTEESSVSSEEVPSYNSHCDSWKVWWLSNTINGYKWFDASRHLRIFRLDVASHHHPASSTNEAESVPCEESVEEKTSMQDPMSDEMEQKQDQLLNYDTLEKIISLPHGNCEDNVRSEVLYQTRLAQDPSNPLLLANYAQFLYLDKRDYNRAEEFFKKAISIGPLDAETHSKYATFLWKVRNDLWAAEETYLEAIEADPTNSYYAANYANFLWNTGGDETCYLVKRPENSQETPVHPEPEFQAPP